MRFTDIFVKRPVLALVVNALVLLVGLRALYGLPVRQYPALSSTVITVSTSYPGATAELMQGFITQPLQQAVATASGVDYITSSSTLGQSTITANIRLNYDVNAAMTDVMAKVQQVRYLMPEGANDPVITKSTGSETAVLYLGFSSPDLPLSAISDYLTRVVQPLLVTVDGVSAADVLGAQSFAMRVWLDPARMAGLDVTAAEVAAALRANNYQTAPGQQKGYFTATNLSANTDLSDVEGFRNLVVRAKDGALVRLRDVADVELGPQSSDQIVAINGLNAVFVAIQVTPTANPLTTVQGVKDRLPSIERTLPPGVQMDVVYDATLFISASIEDVVKTLAEAAIVVVIVIFLFLGSLRAVLIPLVTIPLSLIGVGVFMVMFGFSINLLTLLAMVLAIGLVVDDAIVVVENVVRHIEEGKTPVQAALVGAREIAGPVIVMTITLAAVYAPIGFMGGLTGSLFREFALTLAGSVIISGFVALTLSPMMCATILSRSMLEGRFAQAVNRTLTRVEDGYERWLGGSLRERPVTLVFAMGVLLALGFMYVNTTSELAPQEDQGIVFGVVKGPPYANIDYMDAYRKAIDEALVLDETDTRFIIIGQPTVNQGFVGDVLKPWDERKRTTEAIQPELQGRLGAIPGLQIFMFSPAALPGSTGGLPVQMAVYSTSGYPVVYGVMEKVKKAARDSGLFVVVDSDLAFDTAVLSIDIDRSKANELGVTMQSVGDTLALLLGGNYVNRFNLEGRSYQVIPQTPRGARLNPEDILQFYVRTAGGKQIPLSTIAKVHRTTDPNALSQYNQLNSATFQAVPSPGVSMGDAVAFLNGVADKELPAGFAYTFLGDSRQYVEEGNRLAYTFGFALIVIFLVLAAQFESLRDPFVILISVPMAISGALVPLFFGAATLNIYSQVGLVTLIGLISKHGILMVSFANELQASEGLDRVAAIRKAARIRLRPILMTTAAMVVGLIPMVLATGAGAGSRFAIGIVIVFGLLVGTLFTLFVLPAVYTLLAADHRTAASAERDREIAAVS